MSTQVESPAAVAPAPEPPVEVSRSMDVVPLPAAPLATSEAPHPVVTSEAPRAPPAFARPPVVPQVTPSSAPAATTSASPSALRPAARPAPAPPAPAPPQPASDGPAGFGTLEPGCATVDEAVLQLRINTASFSAIEYQRVRMKIGRLVKKHVENDAAEERLARATSPVVWAILQIGDVLRAFPRATPAQLREAAPGLDLRVKTAGGFVPLDDGNLQPFGGPGSLHVVTVVGGA
jgi:hypothetical protein